MFTGETSKKIVMFMDVFITGYKGGGGDYINILIEFHYSHLSLILLANSYVHVATRVTTPLAHMVSHKHVSVL